MAPALVGQTTYDCTRCWFQNDDDHACLDYGLDWELGWNWYQDLEDGVHYRIRWELYSEQKIEMHPVFSVPRLYYNEQTYLIDTFKAKFNVELFYYYDYSYYCFNVYWSYEDVDIELKMSMKMQECLKDLISCIIDNDNWTGPDAKWF